MSTPPTEIVHQEDSGLRVEALGNPATPENYSYGHEYLAVAPSGFNHAVIFQRGPVPVSGVNGLTIEALLSVAIHRLTFLDGLFPCDENKSALQQMTGAREVLYQRTAKRKARGVEGKEVK